MPARLLSLVLCLLVPAAAPAQAPEPPDTSFQAAIDNGTAAFKAARYDAAIAHFKVALSLDPTSTQAHLFLGTVYAYKVVPNLSSPENLATAKLALAELGQVPETSPDYLRILRQTASIHRDIGQAAAAGETNLHVLRLDPSDADAHYNLGVLDWTEAYANVRGLLTRNHLSDDGNGNPTLEHSACLDLRARNAPLVADGLDHLRRAIDLRPGFDDAMQYLQLTYRRHADLACGDEAARSADLAEAEHWTTMALETHRQHEASTPRPPTP